MALCEWCNGYGWKGGYPENPKCNICKGSGKVELCMDQNVLTVITCRNYEHFLEAARESVFTQTYHSDLVVYHDDCGGDSPVGVAENRNRVVAEPFLDLYDYLIFLDADDILPSNYVEEMLRASNGQKVIVVSGMELFEKGSGYWDVTTPINRETLIERNTIHVSALIPVSVFTHSGGFNSLQAYEDWELWVRLLLAGNEFRLCTTTRLQHRIHTASRHFNKLQTLDEFRNKLKAFAAGKVLA